MCHTKNIQRYAGGRATQDLGTPLWGEPKPRTWRGEAASKKIDRMNRMHKIVESMLFGRIAI